jgi:hypothetical protein
VLDINQKMMIKWLDITSQSEPWISLEEARDMKPAAMVSLGWVIKETAEYITIASTVDTEEELVGDVNCIPRLVIIEMTPLASTGVLID